MHWNNFESRLRVLLLGGILGCVVVWGAAGYFGADSIFAGTFSARFEWDARHGFKTFGAKSSKYRDELVVGRVWLFIVGLQIKPALAAYLQRSNFNQATGYADVAVARILPIAVPDSWSAHGVTFDINETPLMRAAKRADVASVKQLLAARADVNARDLWDKTALLYGCHDPNVVRALIAAGAAVDARGRDGITPLLAAAFEARGSDRITILRELLAAGADVNAKNVSGGTPLMEVAAAGDLEAVALLLAKGADVNAAMDDGRTALSLAEKYKRPEVVELLERAGAQRPAFRPNLEWLSKPDREPRAIEPPPHWLRVFVLQLIAAVVPLLVAWVLWLRKDRRLLQTRRRRMFLAGLAAASMSIILYSLFLLLARAKDGFGPQFDLVYMSARMGFWFAVAGGGLCAAGQHGSRIAAIAAASIIAIVWTVVVTAIP